MKQLAKIAGFSYIEVIIATGLVAISLVPALEGLSTSIRAGAIQKATTEDAWAARALMEEVLNEPFSALETSATVAASATTPTDYSDTYTYPDDRQITRNVFLSLYDADNDDNDDNPFTGTDSHLMWIRVSIPNTVHELETLTTP